jgi:two-component system, NtrC family, nitrogen regulation sensor histidine kinase NtrY
VALSLQERSRSTRRAVSPSPRTAPSGRKPFLDNTPLLLAGIVALIAALAVLLLIGRGSSTLAPDFLTDFVLSALWATNLTILVALAFVLTRNILKLLMERRRALPFARFRAKLVAILLGMAVVPAVLVLLVGSELIRTSVDRWFNQPMDVMLTSANAIAGDYYAQQQGLVSAQAQRLARALGPLNLGANPSEVRGLVAPDVLQERIDLVEVYRVTIGGDGNPSVTLVVDVASPSLPQEYSRTSADRLAERTAATAAEARVVEQLPTGGDLIRTAVPVRAPNGPVAGVVVASEYLTDQFATRARGMTEAYEAYQQLRVLKQPLAGVYLSFFLMLTLMILVGATWMGLYLAKRISRPVQTLAAAADEIGAGHLDYRVKAEAGDEFGSLIDAFNRMADELATSHRRLERSSIDLERKHSDVESRRRYVETILDRLATGVISVDAGGSIRTWNAAASRLLGVEQGLAGLPVSVVLESPDLKPLQIAIDEAGRRREDLRPREVSITREGREVHLSVMTTPLVRDDDGSTEGVVVVFDDVTPLVRAQKVAAWREVARRLAHEIKNPLTPIQLSAERLRRHFSRASAGTRDLVDECTTTIVGEVESLKGLVDEFSQFARMPAPRAVPTDLHALLEDALSLYRGLLAEIEIRTHFADSLPRVSIDPEQIRRVILNLVDNAIEAMDRRGVIDVETRHEVNNNLVRVVVADNGPGIPPAEREKLFLPYYSTKQRGSGLGLAIVRRIVAEHGGSIDVTDNQPRGTRFAIEIPC